MKKRQYIGLQVINSLLWIWTLTLYFIKYYWPDTMIVFDGEIAFVKQSIRYWSMALPLTILWVFIAAFLKYIYKNIGK